MFAFALELAQEKIWSQDGFTEEDQKAVDRLRTFTVNDRTAVLESTNIFFVPDPNSGDDVADEELARHEAEAHCRCPLPKPDQYTLTVDCGSIDITHTPCGKSPWFMFDDWNEVVCTGQDIPVHVDQVTGCHSGCDSNLNKMGCDCGPEVTLTLRKEENSGNDH